MNKIYEFAFLRRDLVKIVAGTCALGLLVFAAGLLSGLGWRITEQPAPVVVANLSLPAEIKQQIELCAVPPQPVAIAWEDIPAVDPADEVAQVVVPLPQKPVQAAPSRRSRSEFAVQLGAFLETENADALSRRLEQRGYDVDVVPMEGAQGRTWYLVRFGAFETRTEAMTAASEFRDVEGIDALVRQSDSM